MKRIILVLVLILLTGCTSANVEAKKNIASNQDVVETRTEVEETEKDLMETISYKTIVEEVLSMNVYHPTTKVYDESPVLLYLHDGAWTNGDKINVVEGAREILVQSLLKRGYTVISADYRLLDGETVFPSNLEDINDCIKFIKDKAEEYGWDENNIGIWGTGAGAQLALIEAYTNDVDYVVDYYGPTDFVTLSKNNRNEAFSRLKTLTGVKPSILKRTEIQEALKSTSPISYVDDKSVPTLIVHGNNDQIVPVAQAQLLYKKLSGDNHRLLLVESDKHGLLTSNEVSKEVKDKVINETINFIIGQYNE